MSSPRTPQREPTANDADAAVRLLVAGTCSGRRSWRRRFAGPIGVLNHPRRSRPPAAADVNPRQLVRIRHTEVATGVTEVLGVVLVEQLVAVGIGHFERAHERRLNR